MRYSIIRILLLALFVMTPFISAYSQEQSKVDIAVNDIFTSLLKDFDIAKEKEFSDNDYVRCFAAEDSGKLSDFVVAVEKEKSKSVLYMAGEIIVE